MSIKVCLFTGKGEPKEKQEKLAPKARKPQAAKNGPKQPFPCTKCESSFPRPVELRRHFDSVHLGLKPHQCTQCDKAYGLKHHLVNHVSAVHDGITVKCDYCEETFAFLSNKNKHIRRKHENES